MRVSFEAERVQLDGVRRKRRREKRLRDDVKLENFETDGAQLYGLRTRRGPNIKRLSAEVK